MYASVNYAAIGPDNGLSPVKYQAIIWSDPMMDYKKTGQIQPHGW